MRPGSVFEKGLRLSKNCRGLDLLSTYWLQWTALKAAAGYSLGEARLWVAPQSVSSFTSQLLLAFFDPVGFRGWSSTVWIGLSTMEDVVARLQWRTTVVRTIRPERIVFG